MTHAPTFRTAAITCVVFAMTLAGCSDLEAPVQPARRYGSIVVEGKTTSATTVSATAKGIFFESTTAAVPNSLVAQKDQCATTVADTTTPDVVGQLKAGDALSLQVGAEAVSLPYNLPFLRYDSPATPFTYTTGTTAQLNVPGNGSVFPGGTVSVLLAEPLLAPPVTVAGTGPLVVTWNGSSSNTSAVLLSLRYATNNSTFGNTELICSLRDDGNIEIPAASVSGFRSSPPEYRSLRLTRFRTSEVELDDKTLLHINSNIDTLVTLR